MRSSVRLLKSPILLLIMGVFFFLTGKEPLAAQGPQGFTFQGKFLNAAGTAPLTDVVDLTLGIYSPDGLCLLYEESHTGIDLSLTGGTFAVEVGSVIGDPKRTGSDPAPALDMAQILSNTGVQLRAPASPNCVPGYTPGARDTRALRVTVTPQAGAPMTLSPDQVINAAPFAVTAETLQGLTPAQFIQVLNNVSQATMTTLTDGSDASALHNHDARYLLAGSATSQTIGTGGASTLGGIGIGVASPPATSKLEVVTAVSGMKGVVIQGAAGQTANLVEIKDSGGTVMTSIAPTGGIRAPGITTSTLTVTGGTPGLGKLLTSDASGNATWQDLSASSFPAPSGDVGGTYSAMSVVKLQGRDIASTAPTGGQVLSWNGGTSKWEPSTTTANPWAPTGSDIYYNTGNVGIGTSAPGSKLDVNGGISAIDVNKVSVSSSTANAQSEYWDDTGSPMYVGMGGSNSGGWQGTGYIRTIGSNPLLLATSNTERMRITPTGDVGIGITGPGYKLDVSGQINASGGLCIAGDCKVTWPSGVTSVSGSAPISVANGSTTPLISIAKATNAVDGYLSAADWTTFNAKEPAISAGTGTQYFRGDKSWATLNTSVVPESGNLYYTDARARAAVSPTGAITYNAASGVFGIAQSSSVSDGYLSAGDWLSFNNKLTSTLNSGQIFVGSAGNVATAVAPTGDMTISPTGITSVTRIQGRTISTTAPTGGQVLTWNSGTSKWEPSTSASNPWAPSGANIYFSTGSVGIGTANPTHDLEVNGNVYFEGPLIMSGSTYIQTPEIAVNNIVAKDLGAAITFSNSASSEKMRIESNGNVGIGTTTPNVNLHIAGTGPTLKFEDISGFAGEKKFQIDISGGHWNLSSLNDNDSARVSNLIFAKSSGEIGINTYQPNSKLDVAGNVAIGSYAGVSAAPVDGLIVSGNVGIGITGPSYKLDVSGQINASGGLCIAGDCKVAWPAGVASVSGSAPISVANGSTTPLISIAKATNAVDGYLSAADWTTFNAKEPAISAGTGTQYFRGDKSWATLNTSVVPESGNLYYTDARARAAVSPTGAITYNSTSGAIGIAQSSSVSDGYLSAGDWLSFNSKLTSTLNSGQIFVGSAGNVATAVAPTGDMTISPTGITSVTRIQGRTISTTAPTGGQVLTWNNGSSKWEPSTPTSNPWAPSGANIYYNTGKVGIGTSSPTSELDVNGSINVGNSLLFGGYNLATASIGQLMLGDAVGAGGLAMGLWTNGSERMHIDTSGNVGIGTSGPSYKLDVSGNGRFDLGGGNSVVMGGSRGSIAPVGQDQPSAYLSTVGSTTNSIDIPLIVAGQGAGGNPTSGNGTAIGIQGYLSTNYRDMAQIASTWTDLTFATRSADLRFYTVNNASALAEKMRITSAGNVGVGVTGPGTALDIAGALTLREMAAPGLSAASKSILYMDSTSHTLKVSQNGGAYSDIATNASIGTSYVAKAGDTMSGPLKFADGTNAAPSIAENSDPSTGIYFGSQEIHFSINGAHRFGVTNMTMNVPNNIVFDSTNAVSISVGASSELNLGTNNLDRVTVLSNGNVGIGITGPSYKLDVSGQINASGGLCIAGVCKVTWPSGVTSVSGSAPISVANGSTTPLISIAKATNAVDGYLSAADWTTFNAKEPAISAGTGTQYFRGDKSWATLNTSVVPESGSLYYTDARARAAVSPTGAITYNAASGVFGIAQSSSVSDGYISAGDWLSFNNKLTSTLNSGQIFVGSAGNTATAVTPSGDLTISPTGVTSVTRIQGRTISTTAPTGGQVLTWNNGSSKWEPSTPASSLWAPTGSDIYYTAGNAGIGTNTPSALLHVGSGGASANSPTPQILVSSPGTSYIAIRDTADSVEGFVTAANSEFAIGSLTSTDLNFSTGDIKRMTISAAGNVGIGTTTPTYKLQVNSDSTSTSGNVYNSGFSLTPSPTSASTASYVSMSAYTPYNGTVDSPSASINGIYAIGDNWGNKNVGTARGIIAGAENTGAATTTNAHGIDAYVKSTNAGGTISSAVAGAFSVQRTAGTITNGYGVYIDTIDATNKFSLYANDSSAPSYFAGNVGVGTTSPSDFIHVKSSADAITAIQIENTSAIGSSGDALLALKTRNSNFRVAADDNTNSFHIWDQNAGLSRVVVDGNGNVGIGTSGPTEQLHIYKNANSFLGLKLENAAGPGSGDQADTFLELKTRSSDFKVHVNDETNNFAILDANAGTIRILMDGSGNMGLGGNITWPTFANSAIYMNSSNNVGIGTNNPGAMLDVTDTSTTTSAIIVPRAGNFTGTNVNGMIRYNTASTLFEFRQNGAWVNYTTVSDGRLKTHVEPVTHGLDIVNQLNPVFYDWDRSNPKASAFENKHQVGFIAQEVEKVLPEVVNRGEDSYRSLEYGKMVSVVVAAVKELYKKLIGHDERLAAQARQIASVAASKADRAETDAKIKSLEAENAQLKAYLCSKDPAAPFCK